MCPRAPMFERRSIWYVVDHANEALENLKLVDGILGNRRMEDMPRGEHPILILGPVTIEAVLAAVQIEQTSKNASWPFIDVMLLQAKIHGRAMILVGFAGFRKQRSSGIRC